MPNGDVVSSLKSVIIFFFIWLSFISIPQLNAYKPTNLIENHTEYETIHVPIFFQLRINEDQDTKLEGDADTNATINQWLLPPRDAAAAETTSVVVENDSKSSRVADKPMQMFRCPISNELISIDQVCDHVSNCADGNDEGARCDYFERIRSVRAFNPIRFSLLVVALFAIAITIIVLWHNVAKCRATKSRIHHEQGVNVEMTLCQPQHQDDTTMSLISEINDENSHKTVTQIIEQLQKEIPRSNKDAIQDDDLCNVENGIEVCNHETTILLPSTKKDEIDNDAIGASVNVDENVLEIITINGDHSPNESMENEQQCDGKQKNVSSETNQILSRSNCIESVSNLKIGDEQKCLKMDRLKPVSNSSISDSANLPNVNSNGINLNLVFPNGLVETTEENHVAEPMVPTRPVEYCFKVILN